jgi:small subunit ribosomal protein S4
MIKVKEKKERALGERLHLKGERCLTPKCAAVRKPYRPGAHGQSKGGRPKTLSDFGKQIMEKQKFKVNYGLTEKSLHQLFLQAQKTTGSTSAKLIELLERRLDNTVFRVGFAPSRRAARQLIMHGHIFVNNRRTRSAGFLVKTGDVISFRNESQSMKWFQIIKESIKKHEAPEWLSVDGDKLEGRVLRNPHDLSAPFEVSLLVESFSK